MTNEAIAGTPSPTDGFSKFFTDEYVSDISTEVIKEAYSSQYTEDDEDGGNSDVTIEIKVKMSTDSKDLRARAKNLLAKTFYKMVEDLES